MRRRLSPALLIILISLYHFIFFHVYIFPHKCKKMQKAVGACHRKSFSFFLKFSILIRKLYKNTREDITIMAITGRNVGKTCRTHYKGTFNDGTQFDSSYDRGEPLEFVCGAGQMIQGFDAAVADMEIGEVKEIHLMPEEAYGQANPDAIFDVEIADLPGSEELQVGQRIYLQNQNGQHFPVTVTAKTETTITFDANHEMAGKELNFKIELVEVK